MKVCLIGVCGHTRQAYKYLKTREDVQFGGYAPGSELEAAEVKFAPELAVYAEYQQMLDREKPDMAVVSPVFGRTAQIIQACAKRGIHVFSEKPVATSLQDLAAVEQAVTESGIRFCAMHYLRYDPAFYHAAKMVRGGAVGQVRMVTAQKSYKYGKRPQWYDDRGLYGGTIPWVGIHAIDWIYHFAGKSFCSVAAQAVGRDPEMAALCQFTMDDGVIASVNIDFYRPGGAQTHGDDRIRCVGDKGVLEVSGGKITLITADGTEITEPKEAPELLEEFLEGREPIPAKEIFYLTRVALLTRQAADTGTVIRIEGEV